MTAKHSVSCELYLDNNSTTPICDEALNEYTKWARIARNPSVGSKSAEKTKLMIKESKEELLRLCGCSLNPKSPDAYTVIYTSCASESNCFIIRSTVCAYKRLRNVKPALIVSAIEHESIMSCCKSLEEDNLADISYVSPNIEGSIPIYGIESAIKPNTCLISVMFANNEIGTINNVREIGALAHKNNIPFHTDAVQVFGKYQIDIPRNNIDALSASYHKFNGPMGLGILFIRNQFIEGYDLHGQINGTQQQNLRGGTENVPAIAAGVVALKCAYKNRGEKNQKLAQLRKELINGLSGIYPIGDYAKYVKKSMQEEVDKYPIEYDPASEGYTEQNHSSIIDDFAPVELLILGPPVEKTARYLPNTVLIAIAKNQEDKYGPLCNINLKKDLDKKDIIVSIGSACQTANHSISHVMKAIRMPENVGRGIIRISLGDNNTSADVKRFLIEFENCCRKQIHLPVAKGDTKPVRVKPLKPTKSIATKSTKSKKH